MAKARFGFTFICVNKDREPALSTMVPRKFKWSQAYVRRPWDKPLAGPGSHQDLDIQSSMVTTTSLTREPILQET